MDTIIFLLIFATLLSMFSTKRWIILSLFTISLVCTALLFRAHATSTLDLHF